MECLAVNKAFREVNWVVILFLLKNSVKNLPVGFFPDKVLDIERLGQIEVVFHVRKCKLTMFVSKPFVRHNKELYTFDFV